MNKAEEIKQNELLQSISEYNENLAELLSMGFQEDHTKKALQLTNDKERAIELIFKFQEDANFSTPVMEASKNPFSVLSNSNEIIKDYSNLKMVFLVRQDLNMGTGKIAAQVGHAVLGAYKNVSYNKDPLQIDLLNAWEDNSQAKIVLKVKNKEDLLEIEKKAREANINTYMVCDAGRTQIEPGSITVCALGPHYSSTIDKITGHLRLL